MRRILSLLVVFGVAGLGPLPVSACALVYSQPGECTTSQTETVCERMGMEQADSPSVKISATNKSCCIVSEAPQPEAQSPAGQLAVAAIPAVTSGTIAAPSAVASTWTAYLSPDLSPPPLQPFLCTFLI